MPGEENGSSQLPVRGIKFGPRRCTGGCGTGLPSGAVKQDRGRGETAGARSAPGPSAGSPRPWPARWPRGALPAAAVSGGIAWFSMSSTLGVFLKLKHQSIAAAEVRVGLEPEANPVAPGGSAPSSWRTEGERGLLVLPSACLCLRAASPECCRNMLPQATCFSTPASALPGRDPGAGEDARETRQVLGHLCTEGQELAVPSRDQVPGFGFLPKC